MPHSPQTPDRLLAEVSHFAGELVEYRSSPRVDVRKELLDSLISRLQQGSTFYYDTLTAGGPRIYYKYLHPAKLEQVVLPGNSETIKHSLVVLPLLDFAAPCPDKWSGSLPNSPFAPQLMLAFELLAKGVISCSENEYLGAARLVAMEGSRSNG
jgi:hypothetical protein